MNPNDSAANASETVAGNMTKYPFLPNSPGIYTDEGFFHGTITKETSSAGAIRRKKVKDARNLLSHCHPPEVYYRILTFHPERPTPTKLLKGNPTPPSTQSTPKTDTEKMREETKKVTRFGVR